MTFKDRINRYLAYNQARKLKAIKFNENTALFFFKIIPYLLHLNSPDLPGYIRTGKDKCPYGIHLFNPQKAINRNIIQRYFPKSRPPSADKDTDTARPLIHSLSTIGSIGSIAQSAKSDCDYWLLVNFDEIPPEGLKLLNKKCQLIEDWAGTHDIEIHLFIMDITQTRENSFASRAEEESAGSAMKLLLKEEFFRTHILVAGKLPLWWLIPPELSVAEYQKFVAELPARERVNTSNFVDLGYIAEIPKAETFGACLWQMNKALDSPFKSVIKFAYLELILGSKETSPLVSDQLKRQVCFPEMLAQTDKPLELDDIDPYLLLARAIVNFYQAETTSQRRDHLIRASLFLKTIEGMESERRSPKYADHLKTTMRLMADWGLFPEPIRHYQNFRYWRYRDLIKEGQQIHNYLIATYKRLRWYMRAFAREGIGLTITNEDIAVLGRKLFTFHQKKPGKIDYIQSLSREMIEQHDITLHIVRVKGQDIFAAFQGRLDNQSVINNQGALIKRDTHLISLLSQMIINGILTSATHLYLTKNYLPIDLSDIQALTASIIETFPTFDLSHLSGRQLLEGERLIKAMAIINFAKQDVRSGKNIQSTIITLNSYGEYFIHDYETLARYKQALLVLLTQHEISRWNKNLVVYFPPQKDLHALKAMLEG
ncbi:class I adenylate cyclase [Desulfobacterota bacterium M19]